MLPPIERDQWQIERGARCGDERVMDIAAEVQFDGPRENEADDLGTGRDDPTLV